MEKTTQEILAGLKIAIRGEKTGYEFYKVAALNTRDPNGKKVFEQLAKEEDEHFRFLSAQYKAFLTAGRLDKQIKLGKSPSDTNNPIFSAQFKERLKDAHFEMSALAVAVQLELTAITHYQSQAAKVSDPDVKTFYTELAAWETKHYEMFLKQQQELQDEYWSEAGFAPF